MNILEHSEAFDLPPLEMHRSTRTAAAIPHDAGAPVGLFSNSGLGQAMGLYLPATVAVRLINFVRVLLLTWWMSAQQFGLLNMILLAINVLTPLCSLGLNEAITRYVPQHETRGSLRVFAWRSFVLLVLITGASVAIMCTFSRYLGDFFYAQVYVDPHIREEFGRDAPELAKVSAGVTGLVTLYFYLLAVFKGLRMFKAVAIIELVHSVIFLAASAIAVFAQHRAAITMTALYGLSLALPIAYFGLRFSRSMSLWHGQAAVSPDDAWARKLLRFSVWTTLAGITWQILVYYPSWYLTKIHGHVAVAIFSAPRQIGQFILIGAVAVVTVVMTTVTKTWEGRGREAAQRQLSLAFRGTGLGLLVLCATIGLARNWIMKMFRPDYAPGADILPLHLLFFLIGSYLAFLPIHFHLIEKTRHLFWPWAVGVAANVLYAFWLAGPKFEVIQQLPAWNWASNAFAGWFVTGFSSPMGLDGAAWCGVFAIATALLLCVVLINAECTRLDRGTYIIILAAGLLAMNNWVLVAGLAILMLAAFRTELIFSHAERRRVIGYCFNSLSHVPAFGRLRARG
ncbi:MAG TPA: lipopolysaccharide biosynthesis protein [Phycisphaerae bacterium]|nr:lipopolysaccharide biosynthesis protein [Phycisphaerae bacterium]